MEDGTTYIDQEAVNHLQISAEYLEQEKLRGRSCGRYKRSTAEPPYFLELESMISMTRFE